MNEVSEPRRSSRVLLFGPADELVLIKRTRPGVPVYLTTPGGGVEPGETGIRRRSGSAGRSSAPR